MICFLFINGDTLDETNINEMVDVKGSSDALVLLLFKILVTIIMFLMINMVYVQQQKQNIELFQMILTPDSPTNNSIIPKARRRTASQTVQIDSNSSVSNGTAEPIPDGKAKVQELPVQDKSKANNSSNEMTLEQINNAPSSTHNGSNHKPNTAKTPTRDIQANNGHLNEGNEEEPNVDYNKGEAKGYTIKGKDGGSFFLDYYRHISAPPIGEEDKVRIEQVRDMVKKECPHFHDNEDWCDDNCIWRFLVARRQNVKAAAKQLMSAIEWRSMRKPQILRWADLCKEAETGKIVVNEKHDKWNRPVLTLDNTYENSSDQGNQMKFLAYSIDRALFKMRGSDVKKYVVVIKLGEWNMFSLSSTPPPATTKETIRVLMTVYCECLGTAILYQPPKIFTVFLKLFESMLDAHQMSKVLWVKGDVSPGSDNDTFLNNILGEHWRDLIGEGKPKAGPKIRSGYNYDEYAKQMLALDEQIFAKQD